MHRLPIIEVPIGSIDGSNTIFLTRYKYVPGSTHVFLNGILTTPGSDEGHVELGGKKIQFLTAPKEGDRVEVIYYPV